MQKESPESPIGLFESRKVIIQYQIGSCVTRLDRIECLYIFSYLYLLDKTATDLYCSDHKNEIIVADFNGGYFDHS